MFLQRTKRASVHSTDMGDADDENSGQNCVSVASTTVWQAVWFATRDFANIGPHCTVHGWRLGEK